MHFLKPDSHLLPLHLPFLFFRRICRCLSLWLTALRRHITHLALFRPQRFCSDVTVSPGHLAPRRVQKMSPIAALDWCSLAANERKDWTRFSWSHTIFLPVMLIILFFWYKVPEAVLVNMQVVFFLFSHVLTSKYTIRWIQRESGSERPTEGSVGPNSQTIFTLKCQSKTFTLVLLSYALTQTPD